MKLLKNARVALSRIIPLRALVRGYFAWRLTFVSQEPSLIWQLPPDAIPFNGRSPANDLEHFFASNSGRLISKWGHYFAVYDRHFSRFRGSEVHILELGVSHGGSLDMWRDYFGPQAKIYGVDIDPGCASLSGPGVEIFIGDQANRRFLRSLAERIPRIDILIDDGGHTMRQQIATFEELFPHVSQNGVYLCEDMHTSYWGRFGGGFRRRGSFVEYSKGLIDRLNAWHSAQPRRLAPSDFTRTAASMHYYDSMLVIEKSQVDHPYFQQRGLRQVGINTR